MLGPRQILALVRAGGAARVRAGVERNVFPERVGKRLELVDPEVGAEDALERDSTDACARETREGS